MKNIYTYLVILALGLTGCNDDSENKAGNYNSGQADFSSYVAVGTSHTAGTMDGTISRVGQSYSFPNILAQQFSLAGGGEFTQPSYEDDVNNLGGLKLQGNARYPTRLIIDAGAGGPENIAGVPTIDIANLQAKAYNNMGIPELKSFHLLASGYGSITNLAVGRANPYFVRHATSPSTTVLADAMSKSPTFFTNWIGNNDVLSFAISGGTGINQQGNPNPESYFYNDITDPDVFASTYSTIVNTLTSTGAKGVVATIPYITSIPFFTSVPHNPLTPSVIGGGNETAGSAAIAQINQQLYGPLSLALEFLGENNRIQPLIPNVANPLLITDVSLQNFGAQLTFVLTSQGVPAARAQLYGAIFGQVRQATDADLILLTARELIAKTGNTPDVVNKIGITYPLPDRYVLTPSEIHICNIATDNFNAIIRSIAASKNLAVADMNETFKQMQSHDGNMYNIGYFNMGGLDKALFSLDGMHPNARGNAYIANEIIKVINSHYGAKLPLVEVSRYPGATILPSN